MPSEQTVVIKVLEEYAAKYPAIKKFVMFGPRARGEAVAAEDYRLAVYAPNIDLGDWAEFSVDFEDLVPTHSPVDLILVSDNLTEDVRRELDRGQVVVYGPK
jgi:predicted nucleotidyltransferase